MTFLPLQSPNVMQKIRKILRAISEKTALPTNYFQQNQSYRTSLKPVQLKKVKYTQLSFARIY